MKRQMKFSRWIQLLLLVLLVVCLCACRGNEPAETVNTETEPETVTVRFLADGNLISEQSVTVGECPVDWIPDLPGLIFSGWQDESGAMVAPKTIPVEKDTAYAAVLYPALSNHVPYLFTDKYGFIRGMDPLTADELAAALRILVAEEAREYLPDLPSGTEIETTQTLREVLESFFPEELLSAAFEEGEDVPVSREIFACIMNGLLGRSGETVRQLTPAVSFPRDLDRDRPGCEDLLEACILHIRDEEGVSWDSAVLEMAFEPGFFHLNGWLYYADESGSVVTNCEIGTLTFGADGRYTSGDAELDEIVVGMLNDYILEDPSACREMLLRTVYLYCRDGFSYVRRDTKEFGETGWEIERAKSMLTSLHGNCYSYAAAFWALARGLGYDAEAISGRVGPYQLPHSWVRINMDGMEYSFDPELEMSYRYERGLMDTHLYMRVAEEVQERRYTYPDT